MPVTVPENVLRPARSISRVLAPRLIIARELPVSPLMERTPLACAMSNPAAFCRMSAELAIDPAPLRAKVPPLIVVVLL